MKSTLSKTHRFKTAMKLTAATFALCVTANSAAAVPLRQFFIAYFPQWGLSAHSMKFDGFPPDVRVIGGAANPPALQTDVGPVEWVDRLIMTQTFTENGGPRQFSIDGPLRWFGGDRRADDLTGPCSTGDFIAFPWTLASGQTLTGTLGFRKGQNGCETFGSPPAYWTVADKLTFGEPVRRTAIDGSEYEAAPMVMQREGVPWITYYAGYRLGFVARESNWSDTNLSKAPRLADWPELPSAARNFELVRLPRPWVEGEIVEYVNQNDFPNTPGGHFFYAANAAEQTLLDGTANWWRTGQSFKSGGYVPVCRVFGSVAPGVSTHFYSADAKECAALLSDSRFKNEGVAFRASKLLPQSSGGGCPQASIPLYRGFNNPTSAKGEPNHRYSTKRELISALSQSGWTDEGPVMCVPQ